MLPILIVIIFGTIYGGILYNRQLAVTQAAREGARFAATYGFGAAPDNAWFSEIIDRTKLLVEGVHTQGGTATTCVWVVDAAGAVVDSRTDGPGTCPARRSTGTDPSDGIRIEVGVTMPTTWDFALYSFDDIVLRGNSVARYEALID